MHTKEQLIETGVKYGLNKEMLENKYNEFYEEYSKRGLTSDQVVVQCSTTLHKLIRTLLKIKLIDINAIMLGDNTTDFGAIMRRKYPEGVYPDTDKNRAGKVIPEHSYAKDVILFDLDNNKLLHVKFSDEDEKVIKSKFNVKDGTIIKVKLEKGFSEGQYRWNEQLSTITIVKQLNYTEILQLMNEKMKDLIASNLIDLHNIPSNDIKIFKASELIKFDVSRFGTVSLDLNDESLPVDNSKNVVAVLVNEKFTYNAEAKNIIFVGTVMKRDDSTVTMRAYSSFVDDIYNLNIQPLVDDSANKDITNVQDFLN